MPPPSAPVPLPPTRHAELGRAIEGLSEADMRRLSRSAELLAGGTDFTGPDLFHEALKLMLEGKRSAWSSDTFVRDLQGILRSIASSKRASLSRRRERETGFHEDQPETAAADEQLDIVARVRQLRASFDVQDDVEAVLVIDGAAQGFSLREAAEDLGLSDKQYDAVRKRITRQKGGA